VCRRPPGAGAGGLPAARARYAESFALRRAGGDTAATAEALEGIALLAAAEGQNETALTLAAAAAAMQPASAPPAPATRALRARYLDTARLALSPEAQARALETGAALPGDEALARAAALVEPP
jgi:hypothetical protein